MNFNNIDTENNTTNISNNNLLQMNNLITPPSSTIRNKVQNIIQNGTINISTISQNNIYNNNNSTSIFQNNFINSNNVDKHDDLYQNSLNNGINLGNVTFSSNPPLSPTKSSPIQSTKAKRQRSEGSSRINGSLSLDEIIKSLIRRKHNGTNMEKPPYSYAILICLSILQSELGKLTLSQIYHWISTTFPYFQLKDSSWQNSIRHNLSLNDGFVKTAKSSDGKGHFWQVKESAAKKFFKHEERSYDEIRLQLRNLDLQLNNINTNNIMSNPSGEIDTNSGTTGLNTINSSLQFAPSPPPYLLEPVHSKTKLLQINDTNDLDSDMDNDNLESSDIEESLNSNNNNNGSNGNKRNTSMVELSSPPSYVAREDMNTNLQYISSGKSDNIIDGKESKNDITNSSKTDKRSNEDNGNKYIKNVASLEPPYQLKRNHTSLSFHNGNSRLLNEFPNEHDIFPQQNDLLLNDNKLISSIRVDSKRYVSSFNSSFELSPNSNQTTNNKLDQLIINSSTNVKPSENSFTKDSFSDTTKTNPSILVSRETDSSSSSSYNFTITTATNTTSNNVQLIKASNYQTSDILKTPIQEYRGFERTPILGNTTPRGDPIINIHNNPQPNDLMLKRWQTPSHLFEDTYSSPILKAMGKTPNKLISTPNGSIIKSPRKLNAPDLTTKTKLSYSGLFGVDVYSVWQRALKDINADEIINTNKNKGSTHLKRENT